MKNPFYTKVDNTFHRVIEDVSKFEQAFKAGGKLEKAIMELGGDPAWLADVVKTLATLQEQLEEAHHGAVGHLDHETGEPMESIAESQSLTEGVLDNDDDDGFMARSQLYFLARDAITLHGMIGDRDNLAGWVQSKITTAAEGIEAVRRYTEYNLMKAQNQMPDMDNNRTGMREAAGDGDYARIIYDYSDNWGSIDIYKNHEKVDAWDDYFGANETGNPLAAKFVEMAEANGLDPMTLQVVDENGDIGKFDGKKFTWNMKEAVAKIACLKCDEVSTAKAWEKNHGFCPKCKTSSQGVAESVMEASKPDFLDLDKDGNKKEPMKKAAKDAKKKVAESKERPYVCVHAKKGKHSCTAGSSYEAAKKAAAHWKLKSTAGIDAHLADVEKVAEEAKFDDKRNGDLKTVAQDMFKNALAAAKKKASK